MKLLYCPKCEDVFRLWLDQPRSCRCGNVTGQYVNRSEALVSKHAISIGLGNGSFQNALMRLVRAEKMPLTREDWSELGRFAAWVRPNSGPGNPHTTEKS